MDKLIQLDDALGVIASVNKTSDLSEETFEEINRRLRRVDMIEAAPVVHARWETADEQGYFRKHNHPKSCSACHNKAKAGEARFCPECGAVMDADEVAHAD